MTPGRVAAVVLAAGASVRMGAPKPLVAWQGRSFVGHVVDRAVAVGCAPIVVVVGAHAIAPHQVASARIVTNPAWRAGPTTSLRAGVAAVGAELSGVVIATVDRPHVSETTWARLLAAHRDDPEAVWQPSHRGRRGHPVLLPAWVIARVEAMAVDQTLRGLLAQPDIALRRREVEVDDAAVLENIDTPDDLRRLPT